MMRFRGMESVELNLEERPSVTPGTVTDDHRDVRGSATQDAKAGESTNNYLNVNHLCVHRFLRG